MNEIKIVTRIIENRIDRFYKSKYSLEQIKILLINCIELRTIMQQIPVKNDISELYQMNNNLIDLLQEEFNG